MSKLSVMAMMGDHLRTRNPLMYLNREEDGGFCGCFIGGAILAAGGTRGDDRHKLFPWLDEASAPNGSRWSSYIGCHPRHGFEAVMSGLITFESLCDYVRSVEPECTCNRFNCDCAKAEQAVAEMEAALAD